jgi:hypothetical protein
MSVKQTLTINENEMLTILMNVNKSTFINVVSSTNVRMNKTNNPYFDKVKKITKSNYLIGNDYETRVQSNEGKEGLEKNFESVENSVGEHVSKCVLFNQKLNTYYLQYELFKESNPTTEFIFDGNSIEKQLFESYMVKKSNTSRQTQERKVFFQSFKLSSINEFTLDGTHYIVER